MNMLTSSIDGITLGSDSDSGSPPARTGIDNQDGPSPETLRALHDDAVRLARGRLLMALPVPLGIAVLIYVMAMDPTRRLGIG